MKVLLIIDMQKASFDPKYPMFDSPEVIKKINKLSDKFRHNGDKVIFIRHDGTNEGEYIPFTEGWEIIPSMEIHKDDLIIAKTANDSFYNTNLKEELKNIEELVITGASTDFCVDATVKSAMVNDFNVKVISDCHTTGNRNNLTAKQLIDHYNWVWQEMSKTKYKINVIDFDSYIGLNKQS